MDALRFVVLLREIQSGSGGGLPVEVGAETLLGQGCQFFRVNRFPQLGVSCSSMDSAWERQGNPA